MVQPITKPTDTTTEFVDKFDEDVETARKVLKRRPTMPAQALFEDILLPLMAHLRSDIGQVFQVVEDLEDAVFADDEEAPSALFVDRAAVLVAQLAHAFEMTMRSAGYLGDDGALTDTIPEDVRVVYLGLANEIATFNTEVLALREAIASAGDGEGDDDGGEGDDGDEGEDEGVSSTPEEV